MSGALKLVKAMVQSAPAVARRPWDVVGLKKAAANDNFEPDPLDVVDLTLSLGEAAPAALFLFPMWAAASAYLKDPQKYLDKKIHHCGEPDAPVRTHPLFAPSRPLRTEMPALTSEDRSRLGEYVQGWDHKSLEIQRLEQEIARLLAEGKTSDAVQKQVELENLRLQVAKETEEKKNSSNDHRIRNQAAAADGGPVTSAAEAPSSGGPDILTRDQDAIRTPDLRKLMKFIRTPIREEMPKNHYFLKPHRYLNLTSPSITREELAQIAKSAAPQLISRAEHLDPEGAFAIEVYQAYQKLGLLPAEPLRLPLRRLFGTIVANTDDPGTRKVIYRLLLDPATPPDLVEDGLTRLRTATLTEMKDLALRWDVDRSPVVLGGVEVLARMQALSGADTRAMATELHQMMSLPYAEKQKLALLTYVPLVQSGMLGEADVAEGIQRLRTMAKASETPSVGALADGALTILEFWQPEHPLSQHGDVGVDVDAEAVTPTPMVWRELWEKYVPADRMREDRRLRWAATQLKIPVYKLFDPTLGQKLPKRVAWRRYELWSAVADRVKPNDADRTLFLTVLERELVFGKLQDPQTARHMQFIRERLLGTKIRPYPAGLEFYHLRHLGRLMTDQWEGSGMMTWDERRMTPANQLPLHLAYWRRELEAPQPLTIDVPPEMRQKVALRELSRLAEFLPRPVTGQSMKTDLAAIEALLRNEIDFNPRNFETYFFSRHILERLQGNNLMSRPWTENEAVLRFRIKDLVRRGITQPEGVDATIAVEMLIEKMGILAGSPEWPADEARAAMPYLESLLQSHKHHIRKKAALVFFKVATAAGYNDDEMHRAANTLSQTLLDYGSQRPAVDILTLGVFAVGDFTRWIHPGSPVHVTLVKMTQDINPVVSGMATDVLGEISRPARAEAWTFPSAAELHDARGVGVPRDGMGYVRGRTAFANVDTSPHLARMSDGRKPMQDPPAEIVPPHEFARIADGNHVYTPYGRFFRLAPHLGYYKSTTGSAEGFQLNILFDGDMQAFFLPIEAVRHVMGGPSAATLRGEAFDIRLQPKGIAEPFFVPTHIYYEVVGRPDLVGNIPWSTAWTVKSPGTWHPMLHSRFRDLAPGWDLITLLSARERRQAGEKLLQAVFNRQTASDASPLQTDYHIGITVIAALLMEGVLETEFASTMVRLLILERESGGRVLAHQLAKIAEGKDAQDLQSESLIDDVHHVVAGLQMAFPILHNHHLWLWR